MEYGADINILNKDRLTPLTIFKRRPEIDQILIKNLATLSFEGKPICKENSDYIKKKEKLKNFFENCLNELKIMKNQIFYNSYSLYDILKMKKKKKTLIVLTKNEDFVAKFKFSCQQKLIRYYGEDLESIMNVTLKKRDFLLTEEKKLLSIFKNFIPVLAIYKVAYYSSEV